MQLLEDDGRADDEDDRYGKLGDDQYFAEGDVGASGLEQALQYFSRLEGRHEHGRVEPGEQADRKGGEDHGKYDLPLQQDIDRKRLTRDGVQPGQGKPGNDNGENGSQQGDEHRLAEELGNDLSAL